MTTTTTTDFPTPKHIKGGCLCGALRYEIDFPPDHDFKAAVCLPFFHFPFLNHPPYPT